MLKSNSLRFLIISITVLLAILLALALRNRVVIEDQVGPIPLDDNFSELVTESDQSDQQKRDSLPEPPAGNTGIPSLSPTSDFSEGISSEIIHIKFQENIDIDSPELLLPQNLRASIATFDPLFTLSDKDLNDLGASNLKLWYRLTLNPGTDSTEFVEALRGLDILEFVEHAPIPAPPP